MVRLDTETKQITHAIRMAAYNAETILARALNGHYARAGDEAYALIREALTASGDIIPGTATAHPARPAHRAPAHPGPRRALRPAHRPSARYPGTDLILRYEVKSHALHKRSPYVRSPGSVQERERWGASSRAVSRPGLTLIRLVRTRLVPSGRSAAVVALLESLRMLLGDLPGGFHLGVQLNWIVVEGSDRNCEK